MSSGDFVLHFDTDDNPTIGDLPDAISEKPALQPLAEVEIPEPSKDPVDPEELVHRDFEDSEFWRSIPVFAQVDRETFLSTRFQMRHSVRSAMDLRELLTGHVSEDFLNDVEKGLTEAPMNLQITPYLLSLIDWREPYTDPIRIQFIPVASTRLPDHPRLSLDSLHEQEDSPTPGLVHRYPDKALFLPLDVCPVYCRFCTRSYAVAAAPTPWKRTATSRATPAGRRPSPTWPRAPRSKTLLSAGATPTCCPPGAFARSSPCCWTSPTSVACASPARARPSCP